MENEKKIEEKKPEEADPIAKAEAVAARIEAANKRTEELQAKQEKLIAQERLGGKSEAGQFVPPKQPETNKEYKDRMEREAGIKRPKI